MFHSKKYEWNHFLAYKNCNYPLWVSFYILSYKINNHLLVIGLYLKRDQL